MTVGAGGTLATSPDGVSWTERTSGFGSSDIAGVGYGHGVWVAVGAGGKLRDKPRRSHLDDPVEQPCDRPGRRRLRQWDVGRRQGEQWPVDQPRRRSHLVGADDQLRGDIASIGYDGSLWVAVGADGKASTSTDGLRWKDPIDSFGGTAMSSVAFSGGWWVTVGAGGTVYTSPPGTGPWAPARSCCGTTDLAGVAHDVGGNLWLAVGDGGKMYTSGAPDTTPWSSVASSGFGTIDIAAAASNGTNHWVAVGAGGHIWTSANGATWTAVS